MTIYVLPANFPIPQTARLDSGRGHGSIEFLMTDILSVILCYDSWSLESDFQCYIPPQQSSSQCTLCICY